MVSHNVEELRWDMVKACYNGETWMFDPIIEGKMPLIYEYLSNKQFLFGDKVKWVVFVLFELICLLEYVTKGKIF